MGIDMQGFSREEGSDELPPGVQRENVSRFEEESSTPPAPVRQPSAPDVQMAEPEPEEDDEAKAKKEAEAEKKKGAEAYKARNFDEAAAAFSKAWDIWPKDITFLTNLAGKCAALRKSTRLLSVSSCAIRAGGIRPVHLHL